MYKFSQMDLEDMFIELRHLNTYINITRSTNSTAKYNAQHSIYKMQRILDNLKEEEEEN